MPGASPAIRFNGFARSFEIANVFVAILISHLPGNVLQHAHPHQQGKHQGQQHSPPIESQSPLFSCGRSFNWIIRHTNLLAKTVLNAKSLHAANAGVQAGCKFSRDGLVQLSSDPDLRNASAQCCNNKCSNSSFRRRSVLNAYRVYIPNRSIRQHGLVQAQKSRLDRNPRDLAG